MAKETLPPSPLVTIEYPATADDFDDEGFLRPDREWSDTRTGYVTREVDAVDAEWMKGAA